MMPVTVRVICVFALAAGLSACEYYKLEEIHRVDPTGTPFQKALAQNYRELSMAEQRAYDWSSAVIYASKSLESAYGHDVAPEMIEQWDIPDTLRPLLEQARADLLVLLGSNLKEVKPQRVADAQSYFDCWLEQQEEGWQTEDIAYCRDGFFATMQELTGKSMTPPKMPASPMKKEIIPTPEETASPMEDKAAPAPAEPTPEKTAEPAPAPFEPPPPVEPMQAPAAAVPSLPEPQAEAAPAMEPEAKLEAKQMPATAETASYIVFFDPGDARLTEMGTQIVDNAAETLKSHATYKVIVNSHTDTYGGAKNPELPTSRAQAVKDRLIAQGIDASSIEMLAKGESKSAEDTLSSAVQVERKIEIFISE